MGEIPIPAPPCAERDPPVEREIATPRREMAGLRENLRATRRQPRQAMERHRAITHQVRLLEREIAADARVHPGVGTLTNEIAAPS
jgi:hypothetical protein